MHDDVDIRAIYDHALGIVRTEVEFDWRALGVHFLRAVGEQQVDFLLGWTEEADRWGHVDEDAQYSYIASGFPSDETRKRAADKLRGLADFLDEESSR